jgi:cytoskeletal protein RodZ
MRRFLNVRLLITLASLVALAVGWWQARVSAREKRQFLQETQPLADVVAQLSIPVNRGADLTRAKETMFGRLVPRNQTAYAKLVAAFEAIDAAAARGEIAESTANAIAAEAEQAARDNLVDEGEVDAFARKFVP